MKRYLLSQYTLKLPIYIVYMMQQVNYDVKKYNGLQGTLIDGGKKITDSFAGSKPKLSLLETLFLVDIYIEIICSFYFAYHEFPILIWGKLAVLLLLVAFSPLLVTYDMEFHVEVLNWLRKAWRKISSK